MAHSVLGLGVPHTASVVPENLREGLQKLLEQMEQDMKASAYEWDMFYIEPEVDTNVLVNKLEEKEWDAVMVGAGVRTLNSLTPFLGQIVNAVHRELPKTKFIFNSSIANTRADIEREFPL